MNERLKLKIASIITIVLLVHTEAGDHTEPVAVMPPVVTVEVRRGEEADGG